MRETTTDTPVIDCKKIISEARRLAGYPDTPIEAEADQSGPVIVVADKTDAIIAECRALAGFAYKPPVNTHLELTQSAKDLIEKVCSGNERRVAREA